MTLLTLFQTASRYTGDGVIKDLKRWIILIVLFIIQFFSLSLIPLLTGYVARIFHNPDSVPKTNDWINLFIDGWKLNLICIMYAIPAIIILVFFGVLSIISFDAAMAYFQGNSSILITTLLDIIGIFGIAIAGVLFIFLTLVMFMAMVRAMRKKSLIEAVNITEIVKDVGLKTGWFHYLILWIILWILSLIFTFICYVFLLIPPIYYIPVGLLPVFIITPLWAVFCARYITLIYDGMV